MVMVVLLILPSVMILWIRGVLLVCCKLLACLTPGSTPLVWFGLNSPGGSCVVDVSCLTSFKPLKLLPKGIRGGLLPSNSGWPLAMASCMRISLLIYGMAITRIFMDDRSFSAKTPEGLLEKRRLWGDWSHQVGLLEHPGKTQFVGSSQRHSNDLRDAGVDAALVADQWEILGVDCCSHPS